MDGVIRGRTVLVRFVSRKIRSERNKDLSQLARKLDDLKNHVRQLEGHLDRERQEKQTLYYKNEALHECWDTLR